MDSGTRETPWRKGCRRGARGRSPVVTRVLGFPPRGVSLSPALRLPGPRLVSGPSPGMGLPRVSVLRMAVCREPRRWEVGQHLRLLLDAENRGSPHDGRAEAGSEPHDHKDQVRLFPPVAARARHGTRGEREPGRLLPERLFPAGRPSPTVPFPPPGPTVTARVL